MLTTATTLLAMLTPAPLPSGSIEAPALIPKAEPAAIIKQVELPPLPKVEYAPFHFAPVGTYPNPFPRSQCTFGAASMKGNVTWSGNANVWDDQARARGITVSDIPIVGSIAQSDRGSAGHVAVVSALDPINHPGEAQITERNYDYNGSDRTSWQPISRYKYIWL